MVKTNEFVREMRELAEAERRVRPFVGDLACDSAASVYRTALARLGVNVSNVHSSGLASVFEQWRQAYRRGDKRIATDSAVRDEFAAMFPEAARVR